MTNLHPSLRRIDPNAELRRLAKERIRPAEEDWPLLADCGFIAENHRYGDQDRALWVRIQVKAEQYRELPPEASQKLMDVIREYWPVRAERADLGTGETDGAGQD